MKLKKWIIGFGMLSVLVAAGLGGWYMGTQRTKSPKEDTTRALWVSDRPIPKTVEPGAYLAALNAVFSDDIERAANYYIQVLQGDPENEKLQREGYFFNALMGRFDELRFVVERLNKKSESEYLTGYVLSAYAVKDQNWSRVREVMPANKTLLMEKILTPVVRAWSYAAEGNKEQALAELNTLKTLKDIDGYYGYHKGLIGLLLRDAALADEGFVEMSKTTLRTVSFYPEIRAFYLRQNKWNAENPVFVQWKLFEDKEPAKAEIVMAGLPRPMTANRGIGEAFYNISSAFGGIREYYEGSLILSALSLYLNPDQELPKIWNAEILEQIGKPNWASYYYAQLPNRMSQTLSFKKAMNYVSCGKDDEALKLLDQLKLTNRDNTSLWLALAGVYQNKKNWPRAAYAYTRILEIEGESNREYAASIYFARSFVYQEQGLQKQTEADLQKSLSLNPSNPVVLNQLGYQWLESDTKIDEGFKLVEKAYELKKSDPHISDSMAYAFYRKNQYDKALPLAEKTVDVMPQSSVANAHLGDIYAALGRMREAHFQYHKALSLTYDLTPELKQELTQKLAKNSAK